MVFPKLPPVRHGCFDEYDYGYLYLITDRRFEYGKVGVSRNIASRIKELQTGNPKLLCVPWLLRVENFREAYACEQHIHVQLLAEDFPSGVGEWWYLGGDVKKFITKINELIEMPCPFSKPPGIKYKNGKPYKPNKKD